MTNEKRTGCENDTLVRRVRVSSKTFRTFFVVDSHGFASSVQGDIALGAAQIE